MDISLLSCELCKDVYVPPKYLCPKCYNEKLVVKKINGKGKIYSYTTIFVAPEAHTAEAPYHIILVDILNGPRVTGRLLQGTPAINQEVQLQRFEHSIYWFA